MASSVEKRYAADDPNITALIERAQRREKVAEERFKKATKMKDEANELFKEERFSAAVDVYSKALEQCGPNVILYCNLAATYLKLESFELAEKACTDALIIDPKALKARYRRGLARKGMKNFKAAVADFQTVLDRDSSCTPAQIALKECNASASSPVPPRPATSQRSATSGSNAWVYDWDSDSDFDFEPSVPDDPNEWPYHYEDGYLSPAESDSEDSRHRGNGDPCRDYNHGDCPLGESCPFSHAPDDKSIRDDMGKNVCLYFLLRRCKSDEECVYSHSTEYLSESGWWDDEDLTYEMREMFSEAPADVQLNRRYIDSWIRGLSNDIFGNSPQSNGHFRFTKTVPPVVEVPAATGVPFLLLLTLAFEQDNSKSWSSHFRAAAESRIRVIQVSNPTSAFQTLLSPDLAGVFVTDGGIYDVGNSYVLDQLVQYAKNGGHVVIGGYFNNDSSQPTMNKLWSKAWRLPWKMGGYHRTVHSRNPDNDLVRSNPSLTQSYSMKAVHLTNVSPENVVYGPTETSHLQSMVFNPVQITDLDEYPVVYTNYGKGHLGFIGDVNNESSSTSLVLAMLGLLDHPYLPDNLLLPRPFPPRKNPNEFILVVSLRRRINDRLLCALRSKMLVVQVHEGMDAMFTMASHDVRGIIVTDLGLLHSRESHLISNMAKYTKEGGKVVVSSLAGGFFPRIDDAENFFDHWKVGWKAASGGSGRVKSYDRNDAHEIVRLDPTLPKSYSVNLAGSVNIVGCRTKDVVYGNSLEGDVPVVCTKVEKGLLAYVNDVEDSLARVVLAVLGL